MNVAPGGENSNQDRLCWFEGEILALVGTGANRSPQARFKRLTAPQSKPNPLVGTWERTASVIDGKPAAPSAPLVLIIGEDGWFSETQLPAGRKSPGKPLDQYTVDDYLKSFTGVFAAGGTYTVEGNTLHAQLCREHRSQAIRDGNVRQFTLEGDQLILRGTSEAGATFESRHRRAKPLETTAK